MGTWKLYPYPARRWRGIATTLLTGSQPGGLSHLFRGWQSDRNDQLWRTKAALYRRQQPEEQAEAFKTFLAYAGCYTLSGEKVTHHIEVSSIQNYVGDLVRSIKFEGDRITLITPPTPVNGKNQTVELIWQRLPENGS